MFENEVFNLVKDEYKVISNYINNKKKVKFKHNKCGNIFFMSPHNFLDQGQRCPKCNKIFSKKEEYISSILDSLNIEYKREFTFNECFYKRVLPFDFAIHDYNLNRILLIEFDGEQHFKVINRSKNKDLNIKNFELTKIRDEIKNNFCKNNKNIYLLRLNYKMNDIEIERRIKAFVKRFSSLR